MLFIMRYGYADKAIKQFFVCLFLCFRGDGHFCEWQVILFSFLESVKELHKAFMIYKWKWCLPRVLEVLSFPFQH